LKPTYNSSQTFVLYSFKSTGPKEPGNHRSGITDKSVSKERMDSMPGV